MAIARSQRPLTGPFWAGIDRGELLRPVCAVCTKSFFSPQVVCPHCQSSNWSYQQSLGHGCVVSHTTIHRPPDSRFEAPYVVADVELDEGWRMLTWIVDCDPDDVEIGQRVRVHIVAGADGESVPAFVPVDASSDAR